MEMYFCQDSSGMGQLLTLQTVEMGQLLTLQTVGGGGERLPLLKSHCNVKLCSHTTWPESNNTSHFQVLDYLPLVSP